MCNKKTQGRSKSFVISICKFVLICCILSDLPHSSNGITTTHYSKPINSKSTLDEYKIESDSKFPNISVAERQKRLLPYINHYLTQPSYRVEPYQNNQQYELVAPIKTSPEQSFPTKFNELLGMTYETPYNIQQPLQLSNIKFTPFSPSNALPGSFVPMVKPQQLENIEVSYVPFDQSKKLPNYPNLYDKLSQIKLRQNAYLEQQGSRHQNPRYVYNRKPQVNYLPEQINYAPVSTAKPYAPIVVNVPIKQNVRYKIKNYNELPQQLPESSLGIVGHHNPNFQLLYQQVPESQSTPTPHSYGAPVVVDIPIKQNVRYQIKDYNIPKQISITESPLRLAEFNNPNLQPIAQPLYPQIPESFSTPKPSYGPGVVDIPNQQNVRYEVVNNYNEQPDQISITENPVRISELGNQQPLYRQIQKPQIKLRPQPNYLRIFNKNPQVSYVVQNPKQYHAQGHRQYLQEVIPSTSKPLVLVPQKQYPQIQYELREPHKPAPKPPVIIIQPTLEPVVTHNGENYEPIPHPTYRTTAEQFPTTLPTTTPTLPTENPNSLSLILHKLQESNTLPHTLTPENIDNSIKTLVRILNSLKTQNKKVIEPIIVAEEGDYDEQETSELNKEEKKEIIKQTFPAENLDGGTPGKPGVDYPALSTIPQTSFNCTTQRYKGFFADPDTHCQVWHYCDLNGGQASFLCPNGTIFSQVALTCDWWFNVKCSSTTQLYVLNERLYKYIIPLTPKFPEDYAGPLVDKYLALKFKEMEEKLKEKAEKESDDDKVEEIDELQLLEDKNNESSTPGSKK